MSKMFVASLCGHKWYCCIQHLSSEFTVYSKQSVSKPKGDARQETVQTHFNSCFMGQLACTVISYLRLRGKKLVRDWFRFLRRE